MITRCVHDLEYLASPLLPVPHGFSTRLGGVSQGRLASLNLGLGRGDDPARVRENYRRFAAATGVDPTRLVMAHQVHGDVVTPVTETDVKPDLFSPTPLRCDGLVTDVPGVALVVFTADCVPILLSDPVRGVVAAVHAGWRGTALQIAGRAVEVMVSRYGCRREDIRAAIGPAIGPQHFETDEDVPQAMTRNLGALAQPYLTPQGDKYHVDLKGINAALLRAAGVLPQHLDVSDACTCGQPDLFFSHRFMGENRGSQAAVIQGKEGIA